jgi:hypothetical protein
VTLSLQTGGQRFCNQAQILHKSHAQHLGAQLLLAHTQVAQYGLRNTNLRSFHLRIAKLRYAVLQNHPQYGASFLPIASPFAQFCVNAALPSMGLF